MSEWPVRGSFEHGVKVGARQVIDALWNLLEIKRVRFDQLAQKVGDIHEAMEKNQYYGLNHKVPDADQAAERQGE